MAARQDGVDGRAEMGFQCSELGRQDRDRLGKLYDGRPFTVGCTTPALLASATGMPPRQFIAGRCSCDVDALRGASGCPDI
jgi:hypothetical protein